jgi:hypothetical protein
MRITTTGLVGIGTTNPGSSLAVSGGGSFGSGYTAFSAPTGGLIVQGNVGIGTSNPGLNALQVSGNMVTSGFTSNSTNTIFNYDTLTVPFVNATQIGIGNTAPTALLDIRGGSISLGSYDSTSASRYVGYYNGNDANGVLVGMEIENTTLTGNYSQKLHFRTHWYATNNGRRLTISEAGNVGIGTTNPGSPLEVVASAVNSEAIPLYLRNNATNTTYNTQSVSMIFGPSAGSGAGTGGQAKISGGLADSSGGGYLAFSTYNGGYNERLRIIANGNVGIGTTNPTSQLQVYGAGQATPTAFGTTGNLGGCLILQDSGTQAYNGGALIFGANQGLFAAIKGSLQNGGGNTIGDLYFATRNAVSDATLTTRVTIAAGGNVGIGITNPTAQLHMYQSTQSGSQMSINNVANAGGTNYSAFIHSDQAYCGGVLGVGQYTYSGASLLVTSYPNNTSNNSGYTAYFGTSANDASSLAPQMVIKAATGNVGIGVPSPGYLLDVLGIVRAGNPVSASIYLTNSEVKWRGDGTAHFSIFNQNSTFQIRNTSANFEPGTAGSNLVTVTTTGNVGIGSTSPAYALDVANDINCTGSNRVNGILQPKINLQGSWSAVSSVTITGFDLATAFYSAEIRLNWYKNGSSGNNGNVSFNFKDTGGNSLALQEAYTYEWRPGGTTANTGPVGYLASGAEPAAPDYGSVIRIWSVRPGSGSRYHYTFESVGCYASIGATTNRGEGYVVASSGTVNTIVVSCSSGTFGGVYSVVQYI